MQPTIYPLFSAPVYYVPDTNFRVDDHTLAKFLDRTEFPDWTDGTGLTSNQFILNDSTYKDIRRVCEFHLQEYTTKICGFDNEFYITNSWLTRNEPSVPHQMHAHPNSIFSGCLYLRSSPKSIMTFGSKNYFTKTWPFTYNTKHANIYNSDNWPVTVDTGSIVIWPSDLLHGSNPNPRKDTRIALCFNTFLKGNIGNTWYGTDLILK